MKMSFGQKINAFITRGRKEMDKMKFRGVFHVEHIRKGKVINKYDMHNDVTNGGLDAILDIMFHNDTQISTWYIGLVDNDSFSAFADADTMSSHSGWIENEDYDEANRQEWTEGAASSQSITNSTAVTFTMDSTQTIHGVFITSNNTKGGTAGTLWSTGAFASNVSVNDDDELKITYTLNASKA